MTAHAHPSVNHSPLRVMPSRAMPLRVMFVVTSMPVGGAETLLVNLVRRMDSARFVPEIVCLKQLGPLGEELACNFRVHHGLIAAKYDVRVVWRLARLMRSRQIDAVVTVGAGDKMFWGRLAARLAGVPVTACALHSTGWPDSVGRLNRMLTPITDAFIGVAREHGRHLVHQEGFPAHKVHVIPNGIDVERFRPDRAARERIRSEWGISLETPCCGLVAALRPEKNHRLLLKAFSLLRQAVPEANLVIVGDGPERSSLESTTRSMFPGAAANRVHFLGNRSDVPAVLAALDAFVLTSDNEANPVSILEAMATELPIVSTRVGSVHESVVHGQTGFLAAAGDAEAIAGHLTQVLSNPLLAQELGTAGRQRVMENATLQTMVDGYQRLLSELHASKMNARQLASKTKAPLPGVHRQLLGQQLPSGPSH